MDQNHLDPHCRPARTWAVPLSRRRRNDKYTRSHKTSSRRQVFLSFNHPLPLLSSKMPNQMNGQACTKKSNDYMPPKSGILSILPLTVVPYAQLMRIEKPGGFYAFYFPHLIGLGLAANLSASRIAPSQLLVTALVLMPLNVLLRGAACSWNDTIDADLDRQVERCRLRPVARGAITETQAHYFTTALVLLLCLGIHYWFPARCLPHVLAILALYGLYPFGKRFTDYPQVILGFPMAWGCWLGSCSLDVDPFAVETTTRGPMICYFVAIVLWTIAYDSIYAHQDVKDDVKAGVRSMAVRFRDSTKMMCAILSTVVVALLVVAGLVANLGAAYFTVTCAGTALALAAMIHWVDLEKPASCMWWFTWQHWFVGGSMTAGLLLEDALY